MSVAESRKVTALNGRDKLTLSSLFFYRPSLRLLPTVASTCISRHRVKAKTSLQLPRLHAVSFATQLLLAPPPNSKINTFLKILGLVIRLDGPHAVLYMGQEHRIWR